MAETNERVLTKAEIRAEQKRVKEAEAYQKRKQAHSEMMKKAMELAKTNPKAASKMIERANKKLSKINETAGDRIFNIITSIILLAVIIIVGYPVLFVISCSFSSSTALQAGYVALWPVADTPLWTEIFGTAAPNIPFLKDFGFTMRGYEFILDFRQVWIGYRNSIFYTVMGVAFTMTATIVTAYPLSKRGFQGRNKYMLIFYLTTLFGAGMIPTFILKTNLGLFDSIWAVLLQGTVAVSHVIILRTAFASSIPGELFDAATIDGANDFQCLMKIAIPLAKATLSVLILYIIVGVWNEYFTSMIYLQNEELHPLQLVLRPIMTASVATIDTSDMSSASQQQAEQGLDQVRYGLIMVATVPPLIAYFVVQKAFKGGIMVGSVKG